MNDKPTYRCGWRIERPAANEVRFPNFPMIAIRRGEFRAKIYPEMFDAMSDEQFVELMEHSYRDATFERLQQDLDILARQLLGQLEQGGGIALTDVPYDDVKGALYRYQKAKRDTQPQREPEAC